MGPGERAKPVHVHSDEEEIFYVLAGDGLSWQDGKTYVVTAGDCVVHRPASEAHTMLGGRTGIDVLAFSSGSDTALTWLPRAGAWWMLPHWLPSDGPSPWDREAAAGDLVVDEPEPVRPPTIVATEAVAPVAHQGGGVDSRWRDLGTAAGSRISGIKHVEVAAGAANNELHCHGAEEEIFVVLAGEGTLRAGDRLQAVRPGHVFASPPGGGAGHQFIAGQDGLTILAWGTREPNDIVWYPDARRVTLCGVGVTVAIDALPVDPR